MNENRPIKQIKPLLRQGITKLSKSEYRFLKLMKELKSPISEEKIIKFYSDNIRMSSGIYEYLNDEWVLREYTQQEQRRLALNWFDRNLGSIVRKNILSDKGNTTLNELMLL